CCACGPSTFTPASGSRFGHFSVEAQSNALADLHGTLRIQVAGAGAYDVQRLADDRVRFTVQGAPQSGDAEVIAFTPTQRVSLGNFRYDSPATARLERFVAFGASLTMGAQDGSISDHSQRIGPAAQVARATAAYLSLPLLKTGILPTL